MIFLHMALVIVGVLLVAYATARLFPLYSRPEMRGEGYNAKGERLCTVCGGVLTRTTHSIGWLHAECRKCGLCQDCEDGE